MEKTPRTPPVAPDDNTSTYEKGDNIQPFVKGSVEESLKTMDKKSATAYDKGSLTNAADTPFEGNGYSVRRLPDDEARAVLEGREGVAARQDSTDEFLTFLMNRPASEDADPQ